MSSDSPSASDSDSDTGPSYDPESVKAVADSKGITDMSDEAAKIIAFAVSALLNNLIQDAAKYMHHSYRQKLTSADVDHALKAKDMELFYEFLSDSKIPLSFLQDKSDMSEPINDPPVKLPREISILAHWLSDDVAQQKVPEKPPLASDDLQKIEAINSITQPYWPLLGKSGTSCKSTVEKFYKLRSSEKILVKQLATHELSVEQQLYYKEITEACVGSDEPRRVEALQSLATNPGLHEMLPRISAFISEGVKVNVVEHNLAILIYLMRMVKAILENQSTFIEKYLHELIPSVCTCLVSKQISMEVDNHWPLRDFAAKLLSQICKTYSNPTNSIQMRIIRMFASAISDTNTYITSLYGAVLGLATLGPEVVKVFVFPKIKLISNQIDLYSKIDETAVNHLLNILMKIIPLIIITTRSPPDNYEEFKANYGSMGAPLHTAVVKARVALSSHLEAYAAKKE